MSIPALTRHTSSPELVPEPPSSSPREEEVVLDQTTALTVHESQQISPPQSGELSIVGERSIIQILRDLDQLPSHHFVVQHTQQQLSHINRESNKQESALIDSFVKNTEKAIQVLNDTYDALVTEMKEVQRQYKVITDKVVSMELGSDGFQKKIEDAKAASAFLQETSKRSKEEVVENKKELISALRDDSILVTQATFDKATQLINIRKDTLAALHTTLQMLHSQQSHELESALKIHDQQLKEQSQKALQLREEVRQKMEAEDQAERIALDKRKQDWQEHRDTEAAALERQKEEYVRDERRQEREADQRREQRDHDFRVLQETKASEEREANATRSHQFRMAELQKPPPPKKGGCVIC